MTFRDNAQLDPSQVSDRRGMGGGGLIVGGGGIGIVILIASLLLGVDPTSILQSVPTDTTTVQNGPSTSQCQTGADANKRDDCRIVGLVDSVQKYRGGEFQAMGKTYEPAQTVLFSGYTDSACGTAQTAMGPFYCPLDRKVYIDTQFFADMRSQLGAQAGPFAQGYVVAHEYGHHVQDLLGQLSNSTRTGANSQSVRTELQADCYGGV